MTDFNQEYIARYVQSLLVNLPPQKCDAIAFKIVDAMDRIPSTNAGPAAMARKFVAMAMAQASALEHLPNSFLLGQYEYVLILRNFVGNLFDAKETVPNEVTRHIFDSVCRQFEREGKRQHAIKTRWQRTLATLQGDILARLLADSPDLALGVWNERTWLNLQDSDEFNVQSIEPFFRLMKPNLRISIIEDNIGYYTPSVTECLVRSHFLSSYPGTLSDVQMDGWPSEWVVALCFSVTFECDKHPERRLVEILKEREIDDTVYPALRHVFISSVLRILGILRDSKASIGQLAIAMNGENWLPFGPCHAQIVRSSNDQLRQELGHYLRNNSLANIVIGLI